MRINHKFLLSVLAFAPAFSACGKKDPQTQLSRSLSDSSWSGIFRARDGGNLLDAKNVKINFSAGSDFAMTLVDSATAKVAGTYQDMTKHRVLILRISESNIESIGKAGTSHDFDYSIEDNELQLKGASSEFKLLQEAAGDDAGPDEKTHIGAWACAENQKYFWTIDIGEAHFFGRVTAEGKRATSFSGRVAKVPEQSLLALTVDQSNNASVQGMQLFASHSTDNKDQLSIKRSGDEKNQLICNRS